MSKESQVETQHGSVTLLREGPKKADLTVVIAPGAGADIRHPFMQTIAEGLAKCGYDVVRFNFAYAEKGRKAPDKQPVLEATYRDVVHSLKADKIVLGGKSMGGRIASHVVADGYDCAGLIYFGYPLHPPGRPDRIRDVHLRDIRVPMLFIEGTRDPFCPLDTLESARRKFKAPTEVAVIEGGDHSFKVPKSSGRSTEDSWQEVIAAASRWLEAL